MEKVEFRIGKERLCEWVRQVLGVCMCVCVCVCFCLSVCVCLCLCATGSQALSDCRRSVPCDPRFQPFMGRLLQNIDNCQGFESVTKICYLQYAGRKACKGLQSAACCGRKVQDDMCGLQENGACLHARVKVGIESLDIGVLEGM
jgi:hypothetical protein